MRYNECVSAKFAGALDYPIYSCCDFTCGLSIWARFGEDRPVWHSLANFGCREALVNPVIPFHEIVGGLRFFSPTDQLTSATGADPGAAENKTKIPVGQEWLENIRATLAFWGKWDISGRGVASVQAPFRLAMAN